MIDDWFGGTTLMNEPYFTVCSPDDPLAQITRRARQADYDAWQACYRTAGPVDAGERDWDEHAATLAVSIGSTKRRIEQHLIAFDYLERLPRLKALIEEMMHLDTYVLVRIAEVLLKLHPSLDGNPEVWEFIDEELTAYLTPTKPAQLVPGANNIVRKLQRVLLVLQKELPKPPPPDPDSDRDAGFQSYPDGTDTTALAFSHDTGLAAILEETIRSHATAQGMTMTQAHADLLLNKAQVKIHLNLYQAHDVDEAPMFLSDNTMLSEEGQRQVAPFITATRDIDAVDGVVTEGYQPTAAQRAFIEGRDGYCRWVGCGKKAKDCDKDHRINHADGGATSTDQMVSACRPHHNRKTEGLVYYAFDHHTGNVYWLYKDGSWVVDEPKGPLAPANRRWLATLADRLKKRRQRLWEQHPTPVAVPDEEGGEPPF